MNKKPLLLIMLLLFAIGALNTTMIGVSAYDSPAIYIDPASTVDYTILPPSTYTIAIKTDYDGTDVWGYQFTLSFNPNVLNAIEVVNGDLITTDKDPTAQFAPPLTIDNDAGTISLTLAFFFYMPPFIPVPATTFGPGTLAYVTFTVVGVGASDIILGPETQLQGFDGSTEYVIIDAKTMPNHIGHGYFQNGDIINEPPVAVISAPSTAEAGGLVTFDGSGSSDAVAHGQNGVIVSYMWDFGDTNTGTGAIVTHAYTSSGIYSVTLTVTDDDGATDTATHPITIEEPNEPPVAVISAPSTAEVNTLVPFDGSGSTDPDGTIVSYSWGFGDGDTSTEMEPTHNYTLTGTYSVTLVVTDDDGETNIAFHTIEITNITIIDYGADLVKWKAKPEAHNWKESRDADGLVTLTALARNLGLNPVNVKITYAILDGRAGAPAGDALVETATLDVGTDTLITTTLDPYDYGYDGTSKVVLYAQVTLSYDSDGDGIVDTDASTKITRFAVVP